MRADAQSWFMVWCSAARMGARDSCRAVCSASAAHSAGAETCDNCCHQPRPPPPLCPPADSQIFTWMVLPNPCKAYPQQQWHQQAAREQPECQRAAEPPRPPKHSTTMLPAISSICLHPPCSGCCRAPPPCPHAAHQLVPSISSLLPPPGSCTMPPLCCLQAPSPPSRPALPLTISSPTMPPARCWWSSHSHFTPVRW